MSAEQAAGDSAPLTTALRLLANSGVELDPVELRDVLWLAGRLTGAAELPLERAVSARSVGSADPRTGAPSVTQGEPDPDQDPDDEDMDLAGLRPLHAGSRHGTDLATVGRPVRLPGSRALAEELKLARALRPIKQYRRAWHRSDLDEEATAARFAETGLLEPVLRVGRERWLRCSLVIDDGLSMLLWQRTVVELQLLLERSGAFRQVKAYGLGTRGPGPVRLRGKPFGTGTPRLSPGVLADPGGQSLVLVVSDGVGAAWRDGRMRAVLDRWGSCGPVAVVQMLPRWMWAGTGLRAGHHRVRSSLPGEPNACWRSTSRGIPVPVVELVPAALTGWARTIAGARGPRPVMLWDDTPDPERSAERGQAGAVAESGPGEPNWGELDPVESSPAESSPAELLARFRAVASPEAKRLAARLAAVAPFTVPVMRLVQDDLRAGGDPVPLAEVFLSGLLEPVRWSAESATAPLAQQQLFDFPPAVRDRLLDAVPTQELLDAGHRLAGHLARRTGHGQVVPALLGEPEGVDGLPVHGTPFAWGSAALLTRLTGGPDRPAPLSPGPGERLDAGPVAGEPREPVIARERTRAAPVTRTNSIRPHFYLSYAHMPTVGTRNPNVRVSQFYEDLCEAVLQLTPLPAAEPVGFMDETMRQGEDWAVKISEALATCRVFVPLYHPRLFRSTPCGQEWSTFAQREASAPGGRPTENSAIVPVLWVGMRESALPPVASALQYNHRGFPPAYAEEGLYALMAQRHHQGLYEKVVYRLARRIVEAALETVVPVVEPVDFTTNPSAFPVGSAADELTIAVLSFKESEVPGHRDRAYYGARRTDWSPYVRGAAVSLAERAAQLARQCDLNPTIQEFEGEAAARLMELERPQGPAVVLIDRWALSDPQRAQLVRELARRSPAWVTVVEPWNRDDPQCAAETGPMAALSEEALSQRSRVARPSFRLAGRDDTEGIPTEREFDLIFQHAAIRAQKAFKERALPSGLSRPRLNDAFGRTEPPPPRLDTGTSVSRPGPD